MVETTAESPQQALLKRLLQIEADAKARHHQAEEHVQQMRTATAEQIQQRLASARTEANLEAKTYLQQVQAEVDATIQQLATANQRQIDAMRQQAQTHLDEAIALVVDWVTGKQAQP
ncbi:MAG: hypothetical protein R3C14_37370 [Caldilineaceae bacterium]